MSNSRMARVIRMSRSVVQALMCAALAASTGCKPMGKGSEPTPVIGAPAAMAQSGAPWFALLDHNGNFRDSRYLAHDPNTRLLLVVAHGVGCPILRKSMPELARIEKEYGERGVRLWFVNSNGDSLSSIRSEAASYGTETPILLDEAQSVAAALGIDRTSEAVLIDVHRQAVRYRGAISNRYDYGAERPGEQTRSYLRDAIEAVLGGKRVTPDNTLAVGCRLAKLPAVQSDYKAVAGVVGAKCATGCHVEGGIAPFALTQYSDLVRHGPMIKEAIMTRAMPPWHADPHVGAFSNDRGLSVDDRRALLSWLDAGSPRGEGDDPLLRISKASDWELGEPDLIIRAPKQEIPAEGLQSYRYLQVPTPSTEDLWVRGYQFRPGNPAVVHHVVVTTQPQGGSNNFKEQAGLGGWAPGTPAVTVPPGSGRLLPRGSELVFQMHYVTTGKPETDETLLGLYLHKAPPEREFHSRGLFNNKFVIPPGVAEYSYRATHTLPRDIMLYMLSPHMHARGRSMRIWLEHPDGAAPETLLSVPNYDFDWQTFYRLSEPKLVPRGTKLIVDATWDNSVANASNPDPTRAVPWGLETKDEMLFLTFWFTDVGPVDKQQAPRYTYGLRSE
jgi:hypothetical protein